MSMTGEIIGGIPTSQPVTGSDWLGQVLQSAVAIQQAKYAAKFAGAIGNQYTGGAAVPMDGNPNAVVGAPAYWPETQQPGLSISNDTLLIGMIMLGVVVMAVALD